MSTNIFHQEKKVIYKHLNTHSKKYQRKKGFKKDEWEDRFNSVKPDPFYYSYRLSLKMASCHREEHEDVKRWLALSQRTERDNVVKKQSFSALLHGSRGEMSLVSSL